MKRFVLLLLVGCGGAVEKGKAPPLPLVLDVCTEEEKQAARAGVCLVTPDGVSHCIACPGLPCFCR